MTKPTDDQHNASLQDHLVTSPNGIVVETPSGTLERLRRNDFLAPFRSDHWFFEICSLSIGVSCLACVIVLLNIYDGKETPQWTGGITLNTVLSWLSTIWQACLLMPTAAGISQLCWVWCAKRTRRLQDVCHYDAASRGPWGSLVLLYRLRKLYLATFGASLTLLILGLGPFTQQTVHYESQSRPDPSSKAQTVAAHAYDGLSQDNDGSSPFATLFEAIPYNMKSAIYSGLLSSNSFSTPSPLFSCPSGNCTWNPFPTLVVDSRCMDVSSSISLNCTDMHFNEDTGKSCAFVSLTNPSWLQNYNATNLMSIRAGQPDTPSNMPGMFASVQWVKALENIAHFPYSQAQSGLIPYITPNTTFEAMNCSFFFSVQQLRVSVDNGVYSEEVIDEEVYGNYYNDSKSNTGPPGAIFNPSFATEYSKNHSNFTVGGTQLNMFASQFVNTFNGYMSAAPDSVAATSDSSESFFVEMMWLSPNLTLSLESMVTYMTNALRGNDSQVLQQTERNSSLIAPDQAVLGTVLVQRQIVIVHWAWLAFPAALVVGVSIFLFATVVVASRASPGIWKSSPLALLFHTNLKSDAETLSEADINNLGSVTTADAMENVASRIKIKVDGSRSDGQVRIFSGLT